MKALDVTLISDGSSDAALLPILRWLLLQAGLETRRIEWADLRRLPRPSKSLPERILKALALYPADLLFIHRDAESATYSERKREIQRALDALQQEKDPAPAAICVVPVKMQEAWLLFNVAAIRHAAGNPNGQISLSLPPFSKLEKIPDPKSLLHGLLEQASGLRGRRLKKFRTSFHARRVTDFIDDYAPLLALPAFRSLQEDVHQLTLSSSTPEPGITSSRDKLVVCSSSISSRRNAKASERRG